MFEELVPAVRTLGADDLGIGVKEQARTSHASSAPDAPVITSDDPYVQEIARLASIYGGVILSGPPGTSKSFYASAAAEIIAGSKNRVKFVQFHASYQYEDFMLGFTPTETSFKPKEGPFLELAKAAAGHPDDTYVLVIDELSRADVGRVFGEALTYVENTKRELPFTIANGEEIKVPENLVILATMNPFDRGVDEVDAAFERRFAKMAMDPDRELLEAILESNGMDPDLQRRVMIWFERINNYASSNPAAAVGHAYFSTASDESSLADIWRYQLKYLVERAFRRDQNTRAALETGWQHIFATPDPPEHGTETEPAPATGD
ncbi:McrB family protein [Cellulomonas sp. C5510]|uniref:McrB family protein n=1 Tax=Cellulomonas sp. C5510 TaxID=2871170 RepID=UPI001C9477E3|nr:AAA family ATPase [Cellulomonas sp. C5510]QZN84914.1 AAA family ATPase [Cellulomonas sp. C5510]